MVHKFLFSAALAFTVTAAGADEISDALKSAAEAYADGDIQYALEELEFAKSRLVAMKTDALVQFLPEAPAGWTRDVNTDMAAGLALMGGGTGAEAKYSMPGTAAFTVSLMADNPMVAGMATMLGSAAALGARIERVGRQKFMVREGEITGLVDNRILVQAKGSDEAAMLDLLKEIDYRALAQYGR